VPEPQAGQALVRTVLSAISPGTEALIYRGLFPEDLPVDENIPALAGQFAYPLKYGYCAVGEVVAAGPGVEPDWLGRMVLAFHPHEDYFAAPVTELLPLPAGLPPHEAVFLPNMETAVSLVMDGRPLLGERVAVLGQGVIGLLTAALLARFPLGCLVTADRYALRRQASLALGVTASLAPDGDDFQAQMQARLPGGADLCYELSGSPAALNQAIALTGFDGRVVVGSWYGRKRVSLDLGGRFHRSRIRLISSQVSNLAPELTGRWDKPRRFALAWQMLELIRPARFITQRVPIQEAPEAYRLLDESPEQTIQVVLEYPTA
jgi:threonine dehydrogenase-like Zn-dependent dehydrogenase